MRSSEQALAALVGALDGPARLRASAASARSATRSGGRAERAVAQQLLQRQDLGVPAAVLERDRQPPVARGERGEIARLVRADRERLVDRRRGSRRPARPWRSGACVWCGVETTTRSSGRRHREQLIGVPARSAPADSAPRPSATRPASLVAMAASSRPGVALIERRVEGRAAEAVADEADAEGTGCGHGRTAYFNRRARRSSRRGRACRRWPRAARRAGACRRRRGS